MSMSERFPATRIAFALACAVGMLLVGRPVGSGIPAVQAQEQLTTQKNGGGRGSGSTQLAGLDEEIPNEDDPLEGSSALSEPVPQINLLWLIWRGGPLMVVLGIFSFAVVALAIDRWWALRDSRLLPNSLLVALGELTESKQGLDPGVAFLVCQDHPSPTANVLRAMLLKVGRPQAEVDRVAAEAAQREASKLYVQVRWLSLIAGLAPLVGLLGTVWGLIQAFYQSTHIVGGQNRAELLASGIYEALVTTLGGLVVAIPAAALAHYFEARIERVFHRVDDLLLNLAPHIEQFEGQLRVEPFKMQEETAASAWGARRARSKRN